MVMNVMDPDRVFKGAEFNLLSPMKGRGHGKCRMGGKNTGGLLTVLPMHFSLQPGGSGAFCILTAQKPTASPLPSQDAGGSHPCGCTQSFACRPWLVAVGEGAMDFCAPGQPMPVLSLLTLDTSASTAY